MRWTSLPATTASGDAVDESYRDEHDELYGRVGVLIVGCRYYSGVIHAGEMANLVREPRNQYDANAVRVDNMLGNQVGHLKRNFAAALAPLLDDRSPCAPRFEARVPREPDNIYSVECQISVRGLPEHAAAVGEYLQRSGLTMRGGTWQPQSRAASQSRAVSRVVATTVSVGKALKSQEDLDKLFDEMGKQQKATGLAEAVARSSMITASLLPHQLEGLAWMLARESGFVDDAVKGLEGANAPTQPLPPLWKKVVEKKKTAYLNAATNTSQANPPPGVRGGILADSMGLGKTLSFLSLIAARDSRFQGKSERTTGTTLVVCPTSVLGNWVKQAQDFTSLSVVAYHGQDRDASTLASHDVVITTYGIVASESEAGGKKRKIDKSSGLLGVAFTRCILDEAHTIRNVKTKSFEAVRAIKATHKWCCTGTPVVNKADDIYALFAFLRAPPVDDAQVFKRAISRPIRDGDVDGLARLRVLVKSLALRRAKSVIASSLPTRKLEVRYVDIFSNSKTNKDAYDSIFSTTAAALHALGNDALSNYSGILECLTRLRQICSGGSSLVPPQRLAAAKQALALLDAARSSAASKKLTKETALKLLSKLKEALSDDNDRDDGKDDLIECAICLEATPTDEMKCISTCLHYYCGNCADRLLARGGGTCALCRASFTRADLVSVSQVRKTVSDVEPTPEPQDMATDDDDEGAPKLAAVVQAVQAVPTGEKCVVFSQFVETLKKTQSRLDTLGVSNALFIGSVSAPQRSKIINAFQSDEGPSVLLVSLKCGGQGCNFTRANHVFLIDPWWNLATEDQALDRVHRIGQSRPVTAVKFVAAKTIEERITKLQETKALVAEGSLSKLTPEQLRKARLGQLTQLFAAFDDADRNIE